MFRAKLKFKLWAYTHAVNCADDWFIDPDSVGTYNEALSAAFKVAAVPVMFNRSNDFSYQPGNEHIDMSQFDLVLLSDIEYRSIESITDWANQHGIHNWILATGGYDLNTPFDHDRWVYRAWWIYNRDIPFNQYQEVRDGKKTFVCDALLGSRRPNRDFVMLSMQKHNLLHRNLVTYREVFTGNQVTDVSMYVKQHFDGTELNFPYVSPNLDPAWEVSDAVRHSDSQTVPWEIYRRSWISLAVESVSSGSTFFMAEKISKPMMARRPFVVFGIRGYLKHLQQLGFKTFHPYIDESYDSIEDDVARWTAAFDQVRKLHNQDLDELYIKLEDRVAHNLQTLKNLENTANHNLVALLRQHIAPRYWLN